MSTFDKAVHTIPQPFVASGVFRKVFTFPLFLGVLLFTGVFFATRVDNTTGSILISEPDTWWHVTAGETILQTHRVPTVDPYSFTVQGQNWMAYEWLGEVLMAMSARVAGIAGMAGLLLILAGTLVVLCYYYAFQLSKSWQASFVTCTALLGFTVGFFTLRPQLFGYVLLLVTLILLEKYRTGAIRHLWALPVIFLLWVNIHGSFVLGFFALAAYWIGGLFRFEAGGLVAKPWQPSERRHILLVALLSLIASMITPYGTAVAAYPLQITFMQPLNVSNIMEWMPLSFDVYGGKLLLAALVVFLLGLLIVRPVFRLESMILLVPAFIEGMIHRRLGFFLLIVLTPLLTVIIAKPFPRYRPEIDKPALNALLIAALLSAMVALHPRTAELDAKMTRKFPVRAVAYLKSHPLNVPMYNEYGWGGFLIWDYPEGRVFVDGRADIYEYAGVFGDYLEISRLGPQTFFLMKKYGIGACLIEPHTPLATVLRALPDWHVVYEDDVSAVFVRNRS